jgi:DNA (cytosine-5)-methyltransferase 1
MSKRYFIDLFAGAGGLSEGFVRAGFEPIAHVEIDEAACFSLKTRVAYHHLKEIGQIDDYLLYLKGKISRAELYSKVPSELLDTVVNLPIGPDYNREIFRKIDQSRNKKEVDVIIGGPPCQAYSLVGRARDINGMRNDPRNYLYVQYANYLERYKPKMFVFENVLGLKSADRGSYLANMEKLFRRKGYSLRLFTVEANNFGVLQNRKRIIIIGWCNGFVPDLPDLESIKNGGKKYIVRNVLSDLPVLQAGEGKDKYSNYRTRSNSYLEITGIRNGINILTQHVARPHTKQDKEIYKIAVKKWNEERERLNYNDLPDNLKTHRNRHSFFDRFKVVAEDLPWSQTVVAHIAKDGHYYIHPDIDQNRSITVREAARLQSFPDDYYFEGIKEGASRTAAFKQIGNAVPPLMAYQIAEIVASVL